MSAPSHNDTHSAPIQQEGHKQKCQEFRNYLENTGILEGLNRGLIALYEENVKPENALSYFIDHISPNHSFRAELDFMKKEIIELRQQLSAALEENHSLRKGRFAGADGQSSKQDVKPNVVLPSSRTPLSGSDATC